MNDEENVKRAPANYTDAPIAPTEDTPTQQVLHETYQVPAQNHAPEYGAAAVQVIVGTPNTLRPPEGFPKYLYPNGDAAAGPGLLCANQEIADDWKKRGYFPEGEAETTEPVNTAEPAATPELMPHQHALDAPEK